jgi:uncharacterized protein DUF4242
VVFVVERYLPGLFRADLPHALDRINRVVCEMRTEGTQVAYLGSTIVPDDESCFCQFEAASEAAVAEANLRADVPFDRIVRAVALPAAARQEGKR